MPNKSPMTSSNRILMVGNFLSKKGWLKSQSELLSEKLESRGHHIICVSSQTNRILRIADMLWQTWFKRNEYQLAQVAVFSGSAFIWAEAVSYLLKFLKKPFILTLHGGGLEVFGRQWPARMKNLLNTADFVTTPSHFLHDKMRNYRDDIIYLPNGLDAVDYTFRLRENPNPRICWLRAFHRIYNPVLAVKVIALLRDIFPTIHLTMIGPDKADGSYHDVLIAVQENNLEEYIDFVGAIPKTDVPAWLEKYDIFINTTLLESFGVAVMEAAAIGLPIVTTNVGELPYLWTQEEDALLVPSDDPQAMANAIQKILTIPNLSAKLSHNARLKSENFDWSLIVSKWEQLFTEVRGKN